MKHNVLVVVNDRMKLKKIRTILEQGNDTSVSTIPTPGNAIKFIQEANHAFDVLITEFQFGMHPQTGKDVIDAARAKSGNTRLFLLEGPTIAGDVHNPQSLDELKEQLIEQSLVTRK